MMTSSLVAQGSGVRNQESEVDSHTFIRFEGSSGRAPLLVGTLTSNSRGDQRVQQWILTDEFRRAAPAERGRLHAGSVGAAAEWLAYRADRNDSLIVGWDNVDRDRFLRSREVPRRIKAVIERHYVP